MTPNNDIKAKLFSMYLGQKVFMMPDWEIFNDDRPMPVDSTYLREDARQLNSGYLLLRSIDAISDEEAVQCAKIGFHFFECTGFEIKVIRELNRISVAAVGDEGKTCLAKIQQNDEWKLNIAQIDYLRSIGIALPITYLDENHKPVTASVSEQVEWGWVKLTTNQ